MTPVLCLCIRRSNHSWLGVCGEFEFRAGTHGRPWSPLQNQFGRAPADGGSDGPTAVARMFPRRGPFRLPFARGRLVLEPTEPFEVVAPAYPRPFQRDLYPAPEQEPAKAHPFLDDPKPRLDRLLAQPLKRFVMRRFRHRRIDGWAGRRAVGTRLPRRLRMAGLFKMFAADRLHDPALGLREIGLGLRCGNGARRGRCGAAGFFPAARRAWRAAPLASYSSCCAAATSRARSAMTCRARCNAAMRYARTGMVAERMVLMDCSFSRFVQAIEAVAGRRIGDECLGCAVILNAAGHVAPVE
jgi:hypothetical protein